MVTSDYDGNGTTALWIQRPDFSIVTVAEWRFYHGGRKGEACDADSSSRSCHRQSRWQGLALEAVPPTQRAEGWTAVAVPALSPPRCRARWVLVRSPPWRRSQ